MEDETREMLRTWLIAGNEARVNTEPAFVAARQLKKGDRFRWCGRSVVVVDSPVPTRDTTTRGSGRWIATDHGKLHYYDDEQVQLVPGPPFPINAWEAE